MFAILYRSLLQQSVARSATSTRTPSWYVFLLLWPIAVDFSILHHIYIYICQLYLCYMTLYDILARTPSYRTSTARSPAGGAASASRTSCWTAASLLLLHCYFIVAYCRFYNEYIYIQISLCSCFNNKSMCCIVIDKDHCLDGLLSIAPAIRVPELSGTVGRTAFRVFDQIERSGLYWVQHNQCWRGRGRGREERELPFSPLVVVVVVVV